MISRSFCQTDSTLWYGSIHWIEERRTKSLMRVYFLSDFLFTKLSSQHHQHQQLTRILKFQIFPPRRPFCISRPLLHDPLDRKLISLDHRKKINWMLIGRKNCIFVVIFLFINFWSFTVFCFLFSLKDFQLFQAVFQLFSWFYCSNNVKKFKFGLPSTYSYFFHLPPLSGS